MTRKEIIEKLKNYFDITELVGRRVHKRYGERAWRFLDTDALHCLLVVREGLDRAITINDYDDGVEQRGLRTNIQPLVKDKTERNKLYVSAHLLGKAFDMHVKGMKAEQVRQWIVANADLFPCKVRLEDGVSWTHMDTIYEEHNPKVYLFEP